MQKLNKSLQSYNFQQLQEMIVLKEQASDLKQVAEDMIIQYDLTQQVWNLNDGNYMQSHADIIIRSSSRIKTNKILFYSNKEPKLLKDLLSSSFPHLTILNLTNNRISSIESLERMDAPHLKSLTLFNNYITNIRCLARISFLNLQQLSLYKNMIVELNPIEQLYADRLKKLFLSCNNAVSIESLFKLSQKNFEQISYRWNKDQNQSLREVLSRKFLNSPPII